MGEKIKQTVSFFKGQKSGLAPESLNPEDSALIYNYVVRQGKLVKINGAKTYYTDNDSSGNLNVNQFRDRFFYQIENSIKYETSEDSKEFSQIDTIESSARCLFSKWQNRINYVNGQDQRYYDGNVVRDIGLLPPGNGDPANRKAFTVAEINFGGTNTTAGVHKYTIVYYDSVRKVLSLPFGSLVTDDGIFNSTEYDANLNQTGYLVAEIDISNTAFVVDINLSIGFADFVKDAPDGVDQYWILKTKAGQEDFFVAEKRDISNVDSFRDGSLDSALTELIILQNLIPPPFFKGISNGANTESGVSGFKHTRSYRDSLFGVGVKVPRFSKLDIYARDEQGSDDPATYTIEASDSILFASDAFLPDYYPFTFPLGRGDDQATIAVGVANDTLCAFKDRSIYVLIGTNITNYVPKIIDPVNGCLNASTLAESPFGIFCLSATGVIFFDGKSPAKVISDDIKDEIERINLSALDNASAHYDDVNNLYYLQVPSGTSTLINRQLIYNAVENSWSVSRSYQGYSIYFGKKSNGQQISLIGEQNGTELIEISDATQTTNREATILARYRSGQFTFGDPTVRKRVKWLYVTCRSYTDFTLNYAVYTDYDQGGVSEFSNIVSSSAFPTYASSQTDDNGAEYGTNRYGSRFVTKLLKLPVSGVGNTFRVEIENDDTEANRYGFEILAVALEATRMSR